MLSIALLAVHCLSSGQSALPAGIAAFNGEIKVRYNPTFSSKCTNKKYEKKPGQFWGTTTHQIISTSLVQSSAGVLSLIFEVPYGRNYFRLIYGVRPDGTGVVADSADFETDISLTENDKKGLPILKQFFSNVGATFIGQSFDSPIRLGSEVQSTRGFCEVIPGGRTLSLTGGYKVIGVASIRGRTAIIDRGEASLTCAVGEKQFLLTYKGWHAIDTESGLPAGQSWTSEIYEQGAGVTTSNEDYDCVVTGSLTSGTATSATTGTLGQTPGSNSAAQRMNELRSLLDKGLITKDEFEQKRKVIIDGL